MLLDHILGYAAARIGCFDAGRRSAIYVEQCASVVGRIMSAKCMAAELGLMLFSISPASKLLEDCSTSSSHKVAVGCATVIKAALVGHGPAAQRCVMLQDMYSEIPVPKSLKDSRNFEFLQRDLRRSVAASDG